MNEPSRWHVPERALVAYVHERAGDSEAWSVEAHVVECAGCRSRLGVLVEASSLSTLLVTSRTELAAASPEPRADRLGWQPVRLASRSLGRWPWVVAVLGASVVALGIARFIDLLRPDASTVSVTWALIPMVPLAGVARTLARRGDPWAEVVLSTPTQGLALVLWRCVAVLAVAAPLTVVAGRLLTAGTVSYTSAAMSLVAMLALMLLALALGTHTGLEVATVVVAGVWSALTLFPVVLAARAWVTPAPENLPAWGALVVASAFWVVLRRVAFESLPTAAWSGIGGR